MCRSFFLGATKDVAEVTFELIHDTLQSAQRDGLLASFQPEDGGRWQPHFFTELDKGYVATLLPQPFGQFLVKGRWHPPSLGKRSFCMRNISLSGGLGFATSVAFHFRHMAISSTSTEPQVTSATSESLWIVYRWPLTLFIACLLLITAVFCGLKYFMPLEPSLPVAFDTTRMEKYLLAAKLVRFRR